VSYREVSNKI